MEKNPERLVVENVIQYEDDKMKSSYNIWIKRNKVRTLYSLEEVGNCVEIESYNPNSSEPVAPVKIKIAHVKIENIIKRLITAWDDGFFVWEENKFFHTTLLHYLYLSLVGINRVLAFERKIYGNDVPDNIKDIRSALIMENYRLEVDMCAHLKRQRYYCCSFDLNTISWLRKIAGPNQSYAYDFWFANHRLGKAFPAQKYCTYKILD